MTRRPDDVAAPWRDVARRLYDQRLAPLLPLLGATETSPPAHHLIVLPSEAMRGIPVEALIAAADSGGPLPFRVSYAPSGTMFSWLRQRSRAVAAAGDPALLALGDPAFGRPDQPAAPEMPPGDREFTALLESTRGKGFAPLPATRHEVLAIASHFGRTKTLLDSKASEQSLEELTRSGRLADYRYLHLATHGVLDDQIAMHSALMLSRDALPDPVEQVLADRPAYDGRLTAEQVLRGWKLDADLVTLSACQTGVAKHYSGGEGYLGFAQAFFVAGSRSLVVSQWEVADEATALLMTRFYQNLLGRREGLSVPLSKAEALAEAKDWLRRLTLAEADRETARLRGEEPPPAAEPASAVPRYGHPFYWAGFILIGDPGETAAATSPVPAGTQAAVWPWVVGAGVLAGLVLGGLLWWRGTRRPT